MDEASYRACIKSLWAVTEHLRTIDLVELSLFAEGIGTEEERRMLNVLRRKSRHAPAPPGHRR
jgi:hypothetical protein